MMKILKKLIPALAILGFVAILISHFLPSEYSVTREKVIPASSSTVYAALSAPVTWEKWNSLAITETDPGGIVYQGPEDGLGATRKWVVEEDTVGRLQITRAEEGRLIGFEYSMDGERHLMFGEVELVPDGARQTRVAWNFSGRFRKNPIEKFYGLKINEMLGSKIDKCLSGLETYCAKR